GVRSVGAVCATFLQLRRFGHDPQRLRSLGRLCHPVALVSRAVGHWTSSAGARARGARRLARPQEAGGGSLLSPVLAGDPAARAERRFLAAVLSAAPELCV